MSPRPVVLVSGWGFPGRALAPLADALAAPTAGLVGLSDLWRPGSSELWRPGAGPSPYAAGLAARLAECGSRAAVLGWSMGGQVALETALAFPGRIARLVLIGTTARFQEGAGEPPGVPAARLRAMRLNLRRAPQAVLAEFYRRVYAPDPAPPGTPSDRDPESAPPDPPALRLGLEYLADADGRAGLDRLCVPTLVLHGREDRVVPWQAGAWLARRIPSAGWHCVPAAGHALPLRPTPALADAIRAFLGAPGGVAAATPE